MPTIFLFMYTIEHFIKQDNLNTSVYFNKSKYFYHINSNYFPWKESKKGHKDINASEFPIKNFKKLQQSISPWICGGHSRYREFLYERID